MKPSEPKLKVLCVGAGRDGTLSLSHMFAAAYGSEAKVMHEYKCREFYQAFCNFRETGNRHYEDEIRRLVRECPYECIVGNGYASILDYFLEAYPDLTLVHIKRGNRAAALASIERNAILFPQAYRYYVESPEAKSKRMAAFHFGDMSEAAWSLLPLAEKVSWYFDKTHALIEEDAARFARRHDLATEEIDSDGARRLVTMLAGVPSHRLSASVHINSNQFAAAVPEPCRNKVNWLLGRFDIRRAAEDDPYPIEFFTNSFVAWTGYQVRRSLDHLSLSDLRSADQLRETIARAEAAIEKTRRDLSGLKDLLAQSEADLSSDRPSEARRSSRRLEPQGEAALADLGVADPDPGFDAGA